MNCQLSFCNYYLLNNFKATGFLNVFKLKAASFFTVQPFFFDASLSSSHIAECWSPIDFPPITADQVWTWHYSDWFILFYFFSRSHVLVWKSCHPSPHHQLSGPLLCVIIISECHATPFPPFRTERLRWIWGLHHWPSQLILYSLWTTRSRSVQLWYVCGAAAHLLGDCRSHKLPLPGVEQWFHSPEFTQPLASDSTGWQRGCGALVCSQLHCHPLHCLGEREWQSKDRGGGEKEGSSIGRCWGWCAHMCRGGE